MIINQNSVTRAITAICLATGFYVLFFLCSPIIFSITLSAMMCIMIRELQNMMGYSKKFFTLLPFYPIIPCLILIYFNQTPDYHVLLFYLFVIVVCFDTTSYLAGTACSKFWITTKIVPAISPGKSWEGALGGYITTTFMLMTLTKSYIWQTCLLNAIICIIAFLGDIFESSIKRSAKIKDSGTLLPGHGGFLDRFDAILLVSYFFFVFKNYLQTILK
jgi:phosphatidate cytidylyltransferase